MNSIRKIISEECPHHISAESIEMFRSILENLAHKISEEAMNEFDKLNKNRKTHGLRELKRLNAYSIKKGAEKILNDNLDIDMGLQSSEIVNLGGKMEEKNNTTKSAEVLELEAMSC